MATAGAVPARSRRRKAPAQQWLTPPEVAKQLGIHAEKVRAWIEQGELIAVNVAENAKGRPTWRIAALELEKFLASRQCRPRLKLTRIRRRRSTLPVKQYI